MAVDATDLDYRARTRSGCIPPELVSRLLEHGHIDVVELHAGRGEWFCALVWARLLGEQGRQSEALEVLAPYLATGWWTAVVAVAELLEGWGRVDDAIEITRVRMKAGHLMALEFYARLLARHGRAEEAFTLMRPHFGELSLDTLVDVAAAAGRDEEAAALVCARFEHRCSEQGSGRPWPLRETGARPAERTAKSSGQLRGRGRSARPGGGGDGRGCGGPTRRSMEPAWLNRSRRTSRRSA